MSVRMGKNRAAMAARWPQNEGLSAHAPNCDLRSAILFVIMKTNPLEAPQKTASESVPLDLIVQKRNLPELAKALDLAGCPLHQVPRTVIFLRNFICCLHLEPSFDHALWLASRWEHDALRPNRRPTLKGAALPTFNRADDESR